MKGGALDGQVEVLGKWSEANFCFCPLEKRAGETGLYGVLWQLAFPGYLLHLLPTVSEVLLPHHTGL